MGKGVVKREKKQRRWRKWAEILRYMAKGMDDGGIVIHRPDRLPFDAIPGRKFTRAELSQINSMVLGLTERWSSGLHVLPSKLKPILALLPEPGPEADWRKHDPGAGKFMAGQTFQPEPAHLHIVDPEPTVTPIHHTEPEPERQVRLKHILFVSMEEARKLIDLRASNGNLPEELPSGTAKRLGASFVHQLKAVGLLTSVGRAKAARLLPDLEKFDVTAITIQTRERKTTRWRDIPANVNQMRERGTWARDLAKRVESSAGPEVGPVEVAAPPAQNQAKHSIGRAKAINFLRGLLDKAQEEFDKATAEAAPYVSKVKEAENALDALKSSIEAVRAADL